jgi:hypothetical protein
MRYFWRTPAHGLALLLGAVVVVGGWGDALAQSPPPGLSGGFPSTAEASGDEMAPRLFAVPGSGLLRMWLRIGDPRLGGGSVVVAASRPGDRWEDLLDLKFPEKGINAREPDLAVSAAGEVALVYQWRRDNPRSKQIRFASSDDGGKRWTQPATQLDKEAKGFEPVVAWTRGKGLFVAWSDERRGRRLFDVYGRRSPDGGKTWEPEQLASRFPQTFPGDLHARPRVLSDGQDRLWLIWVGIRSGRSSVYLSRSVDGGKSWSEPQALTGDSRSVFGQNIVRSGDRMLMVWHDTRTGRDRIYAVTSSDAGVTWTDPVRVDHLPDATPVDATQPTILLRADGEALVAWQDARNGREDIFLSRSSDWGRSWGGEDQRMEMDEPGTAMSRSPKLAEARDGRIALAFEDDRDGHEGVYLRVRSGGAKPDWGPETVVAASTLKIGNRIPELAWGRDGLHVAWEIWNYTGGPSGITKRIGAKTLSGDAR